MREAVLQAVIEVPMAWRQALAGVRILPGMCRQSGLELEGATLTGYCILRGLTFVEILLQLGDDADLKVTAQAALMHFVIEAEGVARGAESEEFAVAFAEVFWVGLEHEREAIVLPAAAATLGIGGTDDEEDQRWAKLLSQYYNPAARRAGEVVFRRRALR